MARLFPGAPVLVVEVTSPHADLDALVRKVRDFPNAAPVEVWVVRLSVREVHRYQRDEPAIIRVYREGDVLETGMFSERSLKIDRFFTIE